MASKGKSLISTVNEDMLLENKYYKRYNKQKQKIKDKYPKDLWNRPIGLARNRKLNYDNHHLWQEYMIKTLRIHFSSIF